MFTEIPVLHDDGEVLVVCKPTGLLTVPGRRPELQDCLWNRLRDRFPEREVKLVHRLDRDTSGLILFAFTRDAQATLGRQFERRKVHKEYVALVHGALSESEGTVEGPIRKDWSRHDMPFYTVCQEKGRSAVTRFRVEAREGEATRVRLFPETGRSHQLRVHMRHLGHPIVGDPIYGPPEPEVSLRLCAQVLGFRHPTTGEALRFEVACPF